MPNRNELQQIYRDNLERRKDPQARLELVWTEIEEALEQLPEGKRFEAMRSKLEKAKDIAEEVSLTVAHMDSELRKEDGNV